MELWIPITIAAAFLQNARSALQKHLRSRLNTVGATYVRFVYAVPFAAIWLTSLVLIGGHPLPRPDSTFLIFAAIAGLSQILATLFLVALFSLRSFAAGTAYSKTETVQAAIIGLLILGDPLSIGALAGIIVSLALPASCCSASPVPPPARGNSPAAPFPSALPPGASSP